MGNNMNNITASIKALFDSFQLGFLINERFPLDYYFCCKFSTKDDMFFRVISV